tara:strand:+ start:834 stop:1517 length:684 start_codon:yes stop_codon:yes gene_type:complete
MKIKNAKEMDVSNVILCATVYGKAGTGKTTLGATFPKPLFLDMNKGLLSIRGMDVDYIELYQANFMEIKDSIDEALQSKDHESIIIDSMGEVAEQCMKHICTMNRRQKPEFADWDSFYQTMRDLIIKIRNGGKHVLCICHEDVQKEEATGRIFIKPAFQGQLKNKYTALFDEVYHSEVETIIGKPPVYKLLSRSSGIYEAKSRLMDQKNQEIYLTPDFKELMKMVER